jgi:hypothetical protein
VQRPGERQGLCHRRIAGGEFVEQRGRPGARCAGGESLWQGAIWGASRGQRRARGEAVLAQSKVERVGPGMGMGEKAGGLEIGEAGDQSLSDARGGRLGAGVEPGQQIGRRAEREQQRAPSVGRGAPVLKTGGVCQRPAQPKVGIGLVLGFFPARAQQRIVVVLPGEAGP